MIIKLNELNHEGHWLADLFVADMTEVSAANWTADLAPDGLYLGRYTGHRSQSGEWIGGEWVDDGAPPAPTEERQRAAQALARERADFAMEPLQDAVDLDDATAAELALLKAWKVYRVALNRMDQQPGWPAVVEWPVPPVPEEPPAPPAAEGD
ncbi:tail fiber assembly protein [Pseudomonas nitroreducens]|uniref:tail fiber assembly protein n=1 Tax=Pseudomonas nitroreducens TaxID=46680 RepID=UPI002659375E|nr:tail fiber assembly protein [Pseudomonas nitroreducens]MCP1652737.1 hypothetical protein [Pseudomonas nitroreducens]